MQYLKAKLFLLVILFIWGGSAFLRVEIPLADFELWGWHVYALATVLRFAPNKAAQRWGLSFWMWTDQGVNVMLGGNEDVTVSSKVGYMTEQGSKTAAVMALVIDFFWYLVTGQKSHCINAIERDEEHY
ncbi:hypothetical protein vBAmaSR9Y2_18 [Alteromonas phage vB_AmaS-R9Y2]|nr:hypothetical protein vBAmaSR9Y2_18 [Alteromonas phage vB_AmaS-R9Y2]